VPATIEKLKFILLSRYDENTKFLNLEKIVLEEDLKLLNENSFNFLLGKAICKLIKQSFPNVYIN
jgi:hypothetical protein